MRGLFARLGDSGKEKYWLLRGMFYAIGRTPNTDLVKAQLDETAKTMY